MEATRISDYRLLVEFESLFKGKLYKHRNSSQGDYVARHLYEDLIKIGRSPKLLDAVQVRKDRVVNIQNKLRGINARRGDGTFGQLIPGESPQFESNFLVAHGMIATVEIGVEVKVLAKAMIKQIDRVINDLRNQVTQFKASGGSPICVAVVGINHADHMTSYEGDRLYPTDGKKHLHPIQEAAQAELRLRNEVQKEFSEFVILRFKATNVDPFPFSWVDEANTRKDYAAGLARISEQYQKNF